jgi:hypothetical protein
MANALLNFGFPENQGVQVGVLNSFPSPIIAPFFGRSEFLGNNYSKVLSRQSSRLRPSMVKLVFMKFSLT